MQWSDRYGEIVERVLWLNRKDVVAYLRQMSMIPYGAEIVEVEVEERGPGGPGYGEPPFLKCIVRSTTYEQEEENPKALDLGGIGGSGTESGT